MAAEPYHCEICAGETVYRCPVCLMPIDLHTHENDYQCDMHGFVNPARDSDGAIINGDGRGGALRFMVKAT